MAQIIFFTLIKSLNTRKKDTLTLFLLNISFSFNTSFRKVKEREKK